MSERYYKVYFKIAGRLSEQSSFYLIKANSKEEAKEKFLEQAKKEYRSASSESLVWLRKIKN